MQRDLFRVDRVASLQSTTAITEAVRDVFQQLVGITPVMVVAVLLLALLIAFDTASINLGARTRDDATSPSSASGSAPLWMAVVESFSIGVLATILGVASGTAMVWWMTQHPLTDAYPTRGGDTAAGGRHTGRATMGRVRQVDDRGG